jgi:hypothetical protein
MLAALEWPNLPGFDQETNAASAEVYMTITALIERLETLRGIEGEIEVEGVDGKIVTRVEVVGYRLHGKTNRKAKLETGHAVDRGSPMGSSLGAPR